MTRLTELDVSTQLQRLAAAFGRPFATDRTRAQGMVREYFKALAELRAEELSGAVDLAIREGDRWPMPAKLRQFATQWRQAHRTAHSSPRDPLDVCKGCGREFYYAGFELIDGTVVPRIRCHCPQASHRWHTSAAQAWAEPQRGPVVQRHDFARAIAEEKSIARTEAEHQERMEQKRRDYRAAASGEEP